MPSYVPFLELDTLSPKLVVDSYHPEAFNLSHWRGANVHSHLQDDTSTGIVLNAIKQNIPELSYPYVSNNHWDIDGFMGIWSLLNPQLAMEYEEVIRAMALLGDFREWNPESKYADRVLKLVCWLNTVEKKEFYKPFGADQNELIGSIEKFDYFLPVFGEVLQNPDRFRIDWEKEFREVKTHLSLKKQEFIPDIRLCVVNASSPLHYYALFAESDQADMVLMMYPENRYELEYKYTTWVDTPLRESFPRISLKPLVAYLNTLEKNGKWVYHAIKDTGPSLHLHTSTLDKADRFDHPYTREIGSSSIPPEQFQEMVISYYRMAYEHIAPQSLWTWKEMQKVNEGLGSKLARWK
ncbi:MAG: DUF6687 family protein [Bacteroidota bacterium]